MLVVAFVGVLGFFLLRGPVRAILMGIHLTKLTNIVETIKATRYTMPIGAGGGVDSLPRAAQLAAEAQFERSLAVLRTHPRHEVTKALVKNAVLANQMGKSLRVTAINRLLDILVGENVAMEMTDFSKSYL